MTVKIPRGCRPVADAPGYFVMGDGRVWSAKSGKFLVLGKHGKGYLRVDLRVAGATVKIGVHVIVARAFIGPNPGGLDVCHDDGMRTNNRWRNLRYDTRSGNLADRDRHGTHQRGERNPAATLSNAAAASVRARRATKEPLKSIAADLGIAESTVSRIANGKRRAA